VTALPLPDLTTGNCRNDPDPDMWHRENLSRRDAHELCEGCPVKAPCLAYALTNPAHGVWGGTTEKQRGEMRKSPNPGRLSFTCKRNHDLRKPGALREKRDGTGKTWEICVECQRETGRRADARRRAKAAQ
jgi:Transcription factor WhiB